MTRIHGLWIAVGLALAIVVFGGVRTYAQGADGHGSDAAQAEPATDAHGDAAADPHDDHEEVVTLSQQEMVEFGIRVAVAQPGALSKSASLPGEITLDADRRAHVTARVAGTVREVYGHLGDEVSAGEPMAVLDSAEMGAAIVAYLGRKLEEHGARAAAEIAAAGVAVATSNAETQRAAVDVARADVDVAREGLGVAEEAASVARAALDRQEAVTENTTALLGALAERVSVEELGDRLAGKDAGANRAILLVAYADLLAAETELEREAALQAQGISSAAEVVVARQARRNAESTYEAARDETAYEVGASLLMAR
ncbi:hypothetical protein HN937_12925, partial [Candidatus Poribacteria bacterium]|nr:hypothetical protein [Candidatus Poribacteria bacterium]